MNKIQLTQAEFDAIPEYSLLTMADPTIGRCWKRRGAVAWYMAELVDGGGGLPEMNIYEIVIEDEVGE